MRIFLSCSGLDMLLQSGNLFFLCKILNYYLLKYSLCFILPFSFSGTTFRICWPNHSILSVSQVLSYIWQLFSSLFYSKTFFSALSLSLYLAVSSLLFKLVIELLFQWWYFFVLRISISSLFLPPLSISPVPISWCLIFPLSPWIFKIFL